MADHFLVQATRNALVNSGGIGEAIGKNDRTAIERRLNHFPDELAATGFEEEELGLRSHGHALGVELEEVPDLFADRRPARLARDEQGHAGVRQAIGQQAHLGRFSTTFRTFKCDERQARHKADLEAGHGSCRTLPQEEREATGSQSSRLTRTAGF